MRRTPRDWQNPPSGTTWASFSAIDHPRKNSVVFRHTSAVGKVIHLSKLLFEIQSWATKKRKVRSPLYLSEIRILCSGLTAW